MSYVGMSRRPPGWAVLCALVGSLLMLFSGGLVVTGEWLLARYDVQQQSLFGDDGDSYGEHIEGPLNILLAGLDTPPERSEEAGRADSIMIIHVPAGLRRAYLISLPRDLLVDIPAMPEADYYGGPDRLNAAMFHGAGQVAGEELPNLERGFQLLAQTVAEVTGISHWHAGAVIDFEGFVGVVDALGGVRMELDEPVVSRHRQPDGTHRPLNPDGVGYHGPQMIYTPGQPPCGDRSGGAFSCELNGWQALDIARQRYSLPDGDFGRQHHQQRLVRAMAEQLAGQDMVTNPVALDRLIRAAGDSLMFDGRGHGAVDFAFALRDMRPGEITMIGLPSSSIGAGDDYQGEHLDPVAAQLFTALATGDLEEVLAAHPELAR